MKQLLKGTLVCLIIIFTGIFFIGCGAGNGGGSSSASNTEDTEQSPTEDTEQSPVVAAVASSANTIVAIFKAPVDEAAYDKESYRTQRLTAVHFRSFL